jgi:aspartokinase-like uncharacterized kinase
MIGESDISAIADAVAEAQASQLAAAVARVKVRCPSVDLAVVTGVGAFVAERSARLAGLRVVSLEDQVGPAARCAPAVAVASLLEGVALAPPLAPASDRPPRDLTIVKVGGGVMTSAGALDAVLTIVGASGTPLVVVPGGGLLADAVRDLDRRFAPGDTPAHWMAVLAMDQLAHLMSARMPGSVLVDGLTAIEQALDAGRIAVLAPYRWLREDDSLPHSWDVTSDSIAAWVARRLRASRLVLVKPPGARGDGLTDAWFPRALSHETAVSVVAADEAAALAAALRSGPSGAGSLPLPAGGSGRRLRAAKGG